jgi:hypothetical protein
MASGLVGGYLPRDPRRGRVSVAKLTALTWALSAAIGLKRYSKSTSGPPVRVDGGRFTAHGQAQARSKGHDVAVNASVSAAEQHSCRGELACRVWGAESWPASWLVAQKDAGRGGKSRRRVPVPICVSSPTGLYAAGGPRECPCVMCFALRGQDTPKAGRAQAGGDWLSCQHRRPWVSPFSTPSSDCFWRRSSIGTSGTRKRWSTPVPSFHAIPDQAFDPRRLSSSRAT